MPHVKQLYYCPTNINPSHDGILLREAGITTKRDEYGRPWLPNILHDEDLAQMYISARQAEDALLRDSLETIHDSGIKSWRACRIDVGGKCK